MQFSTQSFPKNSLASIATIFIGFVSCITELAICKGISRETYSLLERITEPLYSILKILGFARDGAVLGLCISERMKAAVIGADLALLEKHLKELVIGRDILKSVIMIQPILLLAAVLEAKNLNVSIGRTIAKVFFNWLEWLNMLTEKEIKKEFRKKAQEQPEKYYPVRVLMEHDFERRQCIRCGNFFWAASERDVCGEPECSGGYSFIGDTPAKEKMDFIATWKKFSSLFKKLGYAPIKRYPVTARWRDDTDFVQASIYDFQPYVVSGEIDPPASPLVVPQFCVRFNDVDNVGVTGRHYTGFVMMGQHAFETPKNYKPNEYLAHIYEWLTKGMKIPKEELQFHEDAWAGGGNMGPSMEFFSRGLEIGNQVYMQYDIRSGAAKELKIKVLDMGMGQERLAWFTSATSTSYEAVFPNVVEKLYAATGIKPNQEIIKKFLPYSGLLNVDETQNLEKTWQEIAHKTGEDAAILQEHVMQLAGIYSIGDHARSLLVTLSDGALPSNVGGGYNLRALMRRSLDIVGKYNWSVELPEVCAWHAEYLKPQYPELLEHLEDVAKILGVEKQKYKETKEKSRRIVTSLKGKEVTMERLIELYDSQGISPEMLHREGLDVRIPEDFYIRVAERHDKVEAKAQTHKFKEFDFSGVPKTKILYYDDYALLEFKARALKILEGKYVILDKTAFYPTSGGQLFDVGSLNECKVVNVFKQGNIVLHVVENPNFKAGAAVNGMIDRNRRMQLAQHHTGTHIINGVAREILGEHVWQAGAEKTPEKARLDITHYAALTNEELEAIEKRANEIIVQDIEVDSMLLFRSDAEKKFGFRLYQGGAVPGKELRVVKIGELDVEACGGTHLHSTGEARLIKLIGSTKIQDGIVRLEYTAGNAALEYVRRQAALLAEAADVLSVTPEQVPSASKRFFEEWKALRKENERLQQELARLQVPELKDKFESIAGYMVLAAEVKASAEEAAKIAQEFAEKNNVAVLFAINEKISVVGACAKGIPLDMGKIVAEACSLLGGGGGGRQDFARGAGSNKAKLGEAKELVRSRIREGLEGARSGV